MRRNEPQKNLRSSKPLTLPEILRDFPESSFRGRWELESGHLLQYRARGGEEEILLSGPVIAAEPNALVAALEVRQSGGSVLASTVRLAGAWELDLTNRLRFRVQKDSGAADVLTFEGAWETGESNELVYRAAAAGKKGAQTLIFRGFWGLSKRHRLVYTVESDGAEFHFRGAFQTASILSKRGEIRYQLGAELKARKRRDVLVLFGKWKISNKLALDFEMETAGGGRRTLRFGAEWTPVEKGLISVALTLPNGKPLGVEILLERKLLEGEAFVRFQRGAGERRIEGGIRFPW